ncbi:MAG TPA: transglycosylase SLT domain-containing protein [Haliangiales bacterium]|nr:transglycosylase SLT domain-containing protein [Haliangiales bacterium]
MRKAVVVALCLAGSARGATPAQTLGEAWAAYRGGDFAAARRLAAPLVAARLANRDYAIYLAGQTALFLGDPAAALPLFRELAGMEGRFRGIAPWRAADALWALGRLDEARAAYEKLIPAPAPPRQQTGDLTTSDLDGDPGVGLFRVALAHDAAGRPAEALAARRRLALEYPEHPLAAKVQVPLTAKDRLARAERLSAGRGWDAALDELAKIPDGEDAETVRLRDYWIGMTLYRMRQKYDRAAKLLLGVADAMGPLAANAMFHGARAWSRADRDDEAIRLYRDVVKRYPSTPQAAEAQFLSGWLEFNRGRYREGIPGLRGVLDRFGSSKWADDALWYLGFSYLLLGEHEAAVTTLDRLSGVKARYWKARALSALGRRADADKAYLDIVTQAPFSWYALLSRARLKERRIIVGPFGLKDQPAGDVPALGAPDPKLDADPLIARADELIAAGMFDDAGHELARGESAFLKRAGPRGLATLVDRYPRARQWNRLYNLADGRGRAALSLAPKGNARAWWEAAYPRAWSAFVEKHQDLGKNPPLYLYAIMRKESGYDPNVASYADAIGLLQMIPPTTRRVAAVLGLPYGDDMLYDPEYNVRVGSWYIGGLAQKFGRQIPIAAGSFNCGPGPVVRWLKRDGARPMDEWVELASYTQTREYMKRVTEIYARYLYLYQGVVYEQPLEVNASVARDDIDY